MQHMAWSVRELWSAALIDNNKNSATEWIIARSSIAVWMLEQFWDTASIVGKKLRIFDNRNYAIVIWINKLSIKMMQMLTNWQGRW